MTQILPNSGIWWNRAKVPITGSLFDEAILKPEHPEEIRIQRLRDRVFRERNTRISIERAKLMTASYRSSEGDPPMIRRAKAIAHVFREIPISIEEDELLVGRPGAFPDGAFLFGGSYRSFFTTLWYFTSKCLSIIILKDRRQCPCHRD